MTVHGLPDRAPEPLVTRQELAAMLSVSLRQVDKWRADGMPTESDAWGIRVVRFKPSTVIAWLRGRQHNDRTMRAA